MAKVFLDKEDNLIKIADPTNKAEVTGRFGSSLLYKLGNYNFHPRAYEILGKIHRLKFREDDVILTMFPKSGSTWLSECIFLIANQYKYELASKESIELRFPQIDSPSHDVFDLILEQYNQPNQRRLIKSSVPPNLLVDRQNPDCCLQFCNHQIEDKVSNLVPRIRPKVISIIRNPRDVLVSFYHHCKTVKHYDIDFTFEHFFDAFVSGKVPCGPIWLMYNDTIKYHRENPKTTLMIYYEDMKSDLRKQVKRICEFLAKPEPTDEESWLQLLDHLSVERMRQNRTINRHDWTQLGLRNPNGFEFVRKGQVNDWKNYFTEEQTIKFQQELIERLDPEFLARYGAKNFC